MSLVWERDTEHTWSAELMITAFLLNNAYRRNLLYQQISFKWRSWVFLRTLVGGLLSKRGGWFRKTLFTSGFCLVLLLDFFLGCVAVFAVRKYGLQERLREAITAYTIYMLHVTKELVTWLMGVPAGLKLNTPLAHFIGNRCLAMLEFWEYFYIDFIATSLSIILSFILLLSPLGVTVSLTALHDFLKFLNLCLICFYIFSQRLFSLQLSALASLARLFMGKKWNPLRRRVDSCYYDNSQLLLGTVLFTILLFLLPTTGVYFLLFFLLRVIQFCLQFVIRVTVVAVNTITMAGWSALDSSLKDAPVTTMKISLDSYSKSQEGGGRGEEGGGRREVGGGRGEVGVVVHWSGRILSVEETVSLMEQSSTAELLADLECSQRNRHRFQHSMLKFIGSLPF